MVFSRLEKSVRCSRSLPRPRTISNIGLRGPVLTIMVSNLCERNLSFSNGSQRTDAGPDAFGFPQSSALGPLLIINLSIISKKFKVAATLVLKLYADVAALPSKKKTFSLICFGTT